LVRHWQTRKEELANAITHGIGVILSVVALPVLLNRVSDDTSEGMIAAVCIFCVGVLSVYLSSTIFHYVTNIKIKKRLRVWDHVSIFLLIAGTHTPIVLKFLPKPYSFIFLVIMWGLALFGIVMKVFFWNRLKTISLALYVAMGWMSIFVLKPIITNMPAEIFWWMLAGGLFYTLGVPFFATRKLKYSHTIWHCFVLAGTFCHFIVIYKSIPVVVKM
jgi:hemolysin III